MHFSAFTLGLVLILGLGGCADREGLEVTSQSEQMIVIWHNPDEPSGDATPDPDLPMYSVDQVTRIAQAHCDVKQMEAVTVGIEYRLGGRETTFMCMEPANCQWCSDQKSD